MPRVTIDWLEGRTQDQKRRLAKLIVDAVVEVDPKLTRDKVTVVFRQMSRSDWAKGGILDDT